VSRFIGLGGTFVVHDGQVQQHVMPDAFQDCFSEEKIRNWVKYHTLSTPLVAVGTIVNKSSFPVVLTNSKLQTVSINVSKLILLEKY